MRGPVTNHDDHQTASSRLVQHVDVGSVPVEHVCYLHAWSNRKKGPLPGGRASSCSVSVYHARCRFVWCLGRGCGAVHMLYIWCGSWYRCGRGSCDIDQSGPRHQAVYPDVAAAGTIASEHFKDIIFPKARAFATCPAGTTWALRLLYMPAGPHHTSVYRKPCSHARDMRSPGSQGVRQRSTTLCCCDVRPCMQVADVVSFALQKNKREKIESTKENLIRTNSNIRTITLQSQWSAGIESTSTYVDDAGFVDCGS